MPSRLRLVWRPVQDPWSRVGRPSSGRGVAVAHDRSHPDGRTAPGGAAVESVGARETDRQFAGSIPETYDRYLGPLLFEPYARDLAARLATLAPARLLETAAGTGVATRALARALPAGAAILATDLNRPMLDLAAARMETAEVTWQQADALALPFDDGAFDAVACQFGAMFFPDRAAAYREARRVLRPGGRLVLSVWDRIGHNELAHVVEE